MFVLLGCISPSKYTVTLASNCVMEKEEEGEEEKEKEEGKASQIAGLTKLGCPLPSVYREQANDLEPACEPLLWNQWQKILGGQG